MYSSVRSSKDNQSFKRQGSLRKVLPPEEGKANIFGTPNEDLNKFYQICRQEYLILAEYKMVESENVQGVYVIPSRENPLIWFGFVFARSGPFEDGVFRFTIILDDNFPDCQHPKVIFQNDIVHPVIHSESNELNLSNAFPSWNKSEHHIWQILKYIHWIFENVESSTIHSSNTQAAELLQNNKQEYLKRARDLVEYTQEHLYDPAPTEDKHYINFEPYNAEEHDRVRVQMLNDKDRVPERGLSWVRPGSSKPMGRPPTPHSDTES